MSVQVGTTVRFKIDGKKVFGTVRTASVATATGPVVKVQLLPDFAHLLPTGWTDASVDELVPVRVCACATLAFRPQYGDQKGRLFTTGCDFSRMPGRNSKFLPGHDAKAKGFLIRAAFETSTLEHGKGALETARELGDKIAMAVAKGTDKKRNEYARPTRRASTSVVKETTPAKREDELDEIDQLQRELGVTTAMIRAMAYGFTRDTLGFKGMASGPSGTELALYKRGLTTREGYLTDLGYRVMRQPTLLETDPEAVLCKDEQGAYNGHNFKWDEETFTRICRRCGAHAGEDF